MAATRDLAAVCTADGWLRCGHRDTALDLAEGVVSLAWQTPAEAVWVPGDPPAPAGLAFDPGGCLYHGDLDTGQVQWLPWRLADPLELRGAPAVPVDLLAPDPLGSFGQFRPAEPPAPVPSLVPSALALDWDQHLFVLDDTTATIWVFDLDALAGHPPTPARSCGRRPGRPGRLGAGGGGGSGPAAGPAGGAATTRAPGRPGPGSGGGGP